MVPLPALTPNRPVAPLVGSKLATAPFEKVATLVLPLATAIKPCEAVMVPPVIVNRLTPAAGCRPRPSSRSHH